MDDEKRTNLLVVLCGLPAAGKSTLARTLVREAEACGLTAVWINFDDWERALAGDKGGDGDCFDPAVWKSARGQCMEAANAALRREKDMVVVLDDTMHYTSMRLQCWKLARTCGSTYCQVFVDCPLERCMERNAARDEATRIPVEVMERMNLMFEAPREKHAWDACTVVVVPGVCSVWNDISRAKCQAPPLISDSELDPTIRRLTTETVTHQVDIRSRRLINQHIAALYGGNPDTKTAALELNAKRRNMLNACKQSLKNGGGAVSDVDPETTISTWITTFQATLLE